MVRYLLGAFILGAIAILPALATPPPAEALAMSDEQRVLALEQEWSDAEVTHDATVLQRILDDHFVATDENGKTTNKAAFIEDVLHYSMLAQRLAHDFTRVDGDTAILVETDTVKTSDQGKEVTEVYKVTVVYLKRHGQWRAIAEQFEKTDAKPQ